MNKFNKIIGTACEVSGHAVPDHFADVGKTITMLKGAEKEVPDLMLTRYIDSKPNIYVSK